MHAITYSRERTVRLRTHVRRAEVGAFIRGILAAAGPLPDRVVIKPNLNSDRPALTGNSVDPRVLVPLVEALRDLGVRDLTLAEGCNVGVHRRGIDAFRRLRMDRLARRYDVRLVDLNTSEGVRIALADGEARVARDIVEAPFVIDVAKIKTHAEAVLSCAIKNRVGICVGQDKRAVHRNLAENIVRLCERVPPQLVLVDGLVGMEGNGPGDGDPVRLDLLVAGPDPFCVDLTVARLVGFEPHEVPALGIARLRGHLVDGDLDRARGAPCIRALRRAPPRPTLAVIADDSRLSRLKRLVQPLVTQGPLLEAAYRLGVVQDVYSLTDDAVTALTLSIEDGQRHADRLREVCPADWDLIAASTAREGSVHPFESEDCLRCLHCHWALPRGAVHMRGRRGHLALQHRRYGARMETLYGSPAARDAD